MQPPPGPWRPTLWRGREALAPPAPRDRPQPGSCRGPRPQGGLADDARGPLLARPAAPMERPYAAEGGRAGIGPAWPAEGCAAGPRSCCSLRSDGAAQGAVASGHGTPDVLKRRRGSWCPSLLAAAGAEANAAPSTGKPAPAGQQRRRHPRRRTGPAVGPSGPRVGGSEEISPAALRAASDMAPAAPAGPKLCIELGGALSAAEGAEEAEEAEADEEDGSSGFAAVLAAAAWEVQVAPSLQERQHCIKVFETAYAVAVHVAQRRAWQERPDVSQLEVAGDVALQALLPFVRGRGATEVPPKGRSSAAPARALEPTPQQPLALLADVAAQPGQRHPTRPAPPSSSFWDFPLSRHEMKARVLMIDRRVALLDRQGLAFEIKALKRYAHKAPDFPPDDGKAEG